MHKLSIARLLILVGIILAFSTGPADAFMLGKVLDYDWLHPDKNTVYYNGPNLTVGDGYETIVLNDADKKGYLDIYDTGININFMGGRTDGGDIFNGIRLYDVNHTITPFGTVTIVGTNLAGYDSSRVSCDAENIWIDLQSYDSFVGKYLYLSVQPVPLPGAFWLFGAGLVALIGLRRRK